AWAPPRSFDFPTIIAFLEKLGKFAKDYSALSLTYKGGGVFPIRHYILLNISHIGVFPDATSYHPILPFYLKFFIICF
ncbi:MAG: hypothetical protein AB8G05_17975, partial [Oligoflexales bacterium]